MDPPLFATLTPASTRTKLAFSNAFESYFQDRAAARRAGMHVSVEQVYDPEVMRFRRRLEHQRRRSANSPPPPPVLEPGFSFTSSGSEIEGDVAVDGKFSVGPRLTVDRGGGGQDEHELGMIWTGFYGFEFDMPGVPADKQLGWTVGKGRPRGSRYSTDFILVNRRLGRDFDAGMHGIHARFSFHAANAMFFVAKAHSAPDAEVTLEGVSVGAAPAMLSKASMAVRIASLEYVFAYTPFANTDAFCQKRLRHLRLLSAEALTAGTYIVPTPRPGTRTFEGYTLQAPLGKGAFGKVWSAVNTQGKVVAIKVQEVNRRNRDGVNREISTLRLLTRLAEENEGGHFLLRLTQVLRASGDQGPFESPFDEIGLVMEPVAPATVASLKNITFHKSGMAPDVARIFHGILEAINFLHSHNWIHRDIKRENIGLIGNPPRPILLDLGGAIHLSRPGEKVAPVPGAGGTVGYLAPERELFSYDAGVDVWAAGVVGYELARGRHPWRFSLNPWREGDAYERERARWEYKYFEAMEALNDASRVESAGVVVVEPLIKQMLHYPFAQRTEDTVRISISAALVHPVWRALKHDLAHRRRK